MVNIEGNTYDDTANFTCEEGFELESGDLYRVCQEDGMWSGNMPNCVGKQREAMVISFIRNRPGFALKIESW